MSGTTASTTSLCLTDVRMPIAQVTDGMTALDATLIPMQWLIHTRVEPHSLQHRR